MSPPPAKATPTMWTTCPRSRSRSCIWAWRWSLALITALIVTGVMKSRLKSVAPQRDATSYVRQGSMKLTNQRDLYLYREVHRTERPKESSSSDSGGSSTHTSSSGSTHGGGGGSF